MTTKPIPRGLLLVLLVASVAYSQEAGSTAAVRKRVITYNGVLRDVTGVPRAGIVGLTLSLYASQEGGEHLWRESQSVQADDQGRYTILIGATEAEGLPLDVFSDRQAQWLGIQVQGESEQPRILLLAVPYAMKAADADTIGGRPLSSFMLYEDFESMAQKTNSAAAIIALSHGNPASTTGSSPVKAGPARQSAASGPGRTEYHETDDNTWFGSTAGASMTSGIHNSFFGWAAGTSNTTGSHNTFAGYASGISTEGGYGNTFVGASAGETNANGTYNTYVGMGAAFASVSANYNAMYGYEAGYNNAANNNSMYGALAGYSNTLGNLNSFFGYRSGYSNTTSDSNSFFGYQTGYNNTGSFNSFVGDMAGYSNTEGQYNTFVGSVAGNSNTTGDGNSALGRRAGHGNIAGSNNTFLGFWAGAYNTNGSNNLFSGDNSGTSNTTGSFNSFLGSYADGVAGITNATAVGARAEVGASNSLVLGSIAGLNGAPADTKVGIGTTTPSRQLEVRKDQAGSTYIQITNQNDTADASRSRFAVVAGGVTQEMQSIARDGGYFGTTSNHPFRIYTNKNTRMTIDAAGNVGINTLTPTERLHVVGNIRFTGSLINSAPEEDIPDYVFEQGYPLMPLEQLAQYVQREKHLPNVPSAAEVRENGLNLVKLQASMLEKIEELTLYTIQQAKQHKAEVEAKDAQISALEARLSALEKSAQK